MDTWDDLEFWRCGEWQQIQEQLDDLDSQNISYNPDRVNLFSALDACSLANTKVAIIAQDPYPQRKYATGVALSIPRSATTWPVTLVSVIGEYMRDLNYPIPRNGNLEKWCQEGVLLWNAIPTCETGKSLSHYNWEWSWLTKEIIEVLSQKPQGVVFAFLGARAREFENYVDTDSCPVIITSHPSPRGSLSSRTPFKSSRLFSTINDKLVELNHSPIDWRLT
jgi:uracil-DNA glycosylase